MLVNLIREAGYDEALLGISLSYNSKPSPKVAEKLAFKGDGHNKFLESIVVWLDVQASRGWWQQEATYRVGITRQSESTMHTMTKHELTSSNFEGGIQVKALLDALNLHIRAGDWLWVKRHLPESFLQRRIVCTNYATLQRMIRQRENHRLPEWPEFCRQVLEQVEHPGLLKEA